MTEKAIWRVYKGPFSRDYSAERIVSGRAVDYKELSAHCIACAKVEIMTKTGEPADIRGWQKQGMCGSFLKAMRISIDEEEKE